MVLKNIKQILKNKFAELKRSLHIRPFLFCKEKE